MQIARLSDAKQSCAEKIEFRATMHLALCQRELCQLSFGLSNGPKVNERCRDGAIIRPSAVCERDEQTGRGISKKGPNVGSSGSLGESIFCIAA